jgi:hypothetical protein
MEFGKYESTMKSISSKFGNVVSAIFAITVLILSILAIESEWKLHNPNIVQGYEHLISGDVGGFFKLFLGPFLLVMIPVSLIITVCFILLTIYALITNYKEMNSDERKGAISGYLDFIWAMSYGMVPISFFIFSGAYIASDSFQKSVVIILFMFWRERIRKHDKASIDRIRIRVLWNTNEVLKNLNYSNNERRDAVHDNTTIEQIDHTDEDTEFLHPNLGHGIAEDVLVIIHFISIVVLSLNLVYTLAEY